MSLELTVCIPVYNEEKTIASTLESLNLQSRAPLFQVLVYANGCNDRTIEIAKEYGVKYPSLRLEVIEDSEKGKPNAWNHLRQLAETEKQIFLDGDVFVDKLALASMNKALENTSGIAVCGNPVAIWNNSRFLSKTLCFYDSGIFGDSIVGRIYGFHNSRMQNRLEQRGFSEMPKEIIDEDYWLNLIVGTSNLVFEPKAIAYFVPSKWYDAVKLIRRHTRANRQIQDKYSQLILPTSENILNNPKSFKRRLERLIKKPGFSGKAELCLKFFLRQLVAGYCSFQINHEKLNNPLDGFETAPSTKVPLSTKDIPLQQI